MILSFLALCLIDKGASISLNCEFGHKMWDYHEDYSNYMCETIQIEEILTQNNREITEVTGDHSSHENLSDVKGFNVENKTVSYVPKNLLKFFPNIRALEIINCHLKEIRSEDLEPFGEKLNFLHLNDNDIEYLEQDLFAKNPNLLSLKFNNNNIKFVHAALFENLNQLRTLWMDTRNPCFEGIEDVLEVEIAIKNVVDKCSSGYEEFAKANNLKKANQNTADSKNSVQVMKKSDLGLLNQFISYTKEMQKVCSDDNAILFNKKLEVKKKNTKLVQEFNGLEAEIEKMKKEMTSLKEQLANVKVKGNCNSSKSKTDDLIVTTIICPNEY